MSTTHERNPTDGWRTGLLGGLASGTFSTAVVSLGARRIGRDPQLDWMEAATVALRDRAIHTQPGWGEVVAGVLVHQSADLAWALVFFGLGARWSRRLRPPALLALSAPWALITSAIEYYLILPWLQPILPMQVPYWTALTVHLASGTVYPLYPWIRERASGQEQTDKTFVRCWAAVLAGGLGLLAGLTALVRAGYGPPWPFAAKQAREYDRTFLHHMTAHHQIGERLATMAVEKGIRHEFCVLNELILAEHQAEIDLMCDWWRRWYKEEMPTITAKEYMEIAGMPAPAAIKELETLEGLDFEEHYLPIMIFHHEGAITMANNAWEQAGDPRLRILADSIRHSQRGQIERMAALFRKGVTLRAEASRS
ncbi:MAG: DUF305 domain-containing protein [Ardenticatenaceae bacterium]|nr:DUF305 domain-containing protein [Ardenticatenaceae bacterium]